MKNIRAILSLLFALLLGVLIGFFISQELVRHRVKDVESLSSYESFKSRLHTLIEPTQKQMEDIGPVIEKYSKKLDELKKRFRSDYGKTIQEFHKELRPHLNAEQIEKLDNFPKYFSRKHRHKPADSTRHRK